MELKEGCPPLLMDIKVWIVYPPKVKREASPIGLKLSA